MWLHHRVMSPNDADGMANSVDPDPDCSSSLIWVCTVCPGISVQKLRIITVTVFKQTLPSRVKSDIGQNRNSLKFPTPPLPHGHSVISTLVTHKTRDTLKLLLCWWQQRLKDLVAMQGMYNGDRHHRKLVVISSKILEDSRTLTPRLSVKQCEF